MIPDSQIPSAESWNKKNRNYYQDTPPTGTLSLGDVWFDTSNHNRRHWWDGSKWVDAEDVSPIDASQRPVTSRGLGGVIEMDHKGMRFIRKADNEITLQMDIETGSAYFKGDITGASGTFSGRIEAEEGYFRGDITGATGTFSGELAAKSIKAEWFEEIRNVLPYTGQDSLDADKPIVIPFYIPSETTKIVAAFLSAEARRYRAYSKSAPYTEHYWWNKRTGNVATFGETPVTVTLQTTSASGTTGIQTLRHRHYEPDGIYIMTGGVKDDESSMFNLGHNHSFNYIRASGVQLNNFNDHKHELDPSHAHDLEFGIHEDTTPANVRIRINNGSGWSGYISLAPAPSDNAAYDLIAGASVPKHNNNASEMDLTPYLSGTGWKHIEFSSSRLGLIAWNIILKLDITA